MHTVLGTNMFKVSGRVVRCFVGSIGLLFLFANLSAYAQETVCARVKIEIKQELTLERQAFDAEMKISNTTDSAVIENVAIEVKITDEAGTSTIITSDPNDLSAKFFVRLSNKQNISAIDGSGTVNPKTTSIINWLIIPAPGSAGSSPVGKKYLVGATLRYKFGGEETILTVSPDVITVKPLPLLSLDYFLTQDVLADDPLTPGIEATEPFTLGVRVKNTGYSTAKNLKIDSAQPKIVENNQGLLINFLITGSYLNDSPVQNSLLINFGDVAANSSKMGRWVMESTLAGRFTEFSALFSHADELGGALTSILQATNAHLLLRDVRVDLPGRDYVRDFLAQDGDVIRVYESDGPDTLVNDKSSVATLTSATEINGNPHFTLSYPAASGFTFVRLADPFNGTKVFGKVIRSDAKDMLPENIWFSKTRNEQTKELQYWINFFDVNSTGQYDAEFQAPPPAATPPALQFIPDRVVDENQQVSFLVEASSALGSALRLSAAPLPVGATFTAQPADLTNPGLTRAIFDWTPSKGSAGSYLVSYFANDGVLTTSRSATIRVQAVAVLPGPGTPTIESPLPGAQVSTLKPVLSVMASSAAQDPTKSIQFEVYSDEAKSQLLTTLTVPAATPVTGENTGSVPQATRTQLTEDLADNTHYWWRARGFDESLYSPWVSGRFFVNLFNDPPDSFNLTSPVPGAEVRTLTPTLAWTNSVDKDGETISYSVLVYKDAAATELAAQAQDIAPDTSGSTSWTVTTPLVNHQTYYWRVVAKDALGAQTATPTRSFLVYTGNTAPNAPALIAPPMGGESASLTTELVINNSSDAESDFISYVFEIDSVNTFDSANKRSSGPVVQGSVATRWTTPPLVENQRYWWRVKAQDGRAESAWVTSNFLMNAVNDPPPAPTVKNPGNGAWTATLQPSLESNPVIDPEGEVVGYQFEIYADERMTSLVTDGRSSNTGFILPRPLKDKATYWWHVRAFDPHGAFSAWSAPTVLYVSSAPYQQPTIALTTPATAVMPDQVSSTSGTRKQVTLRWEGMDPNIEPTIALYWDKKNSGYAGNVIVDGLRQSAGMQSGSYVWDVTDMASGTYYPYAVIYDAKGKGRAYAPGALVIPSTNQLGSITVTAGKNLRTSEDGLSATFSVRLGREPTASVEVPIWSGNVNEGTTSPASLTFTSKNWASNQTVTVTGQKDCLQDGRKTYQVFSGQAQSIDPEYIGLSGKSVDVMNADSVRPQTKTDNPNFHICGLTQVSERKVNARTWEYTLRAELTNSGADVKGVTSKLQSVPLNLQIVDGTLKYGAIGQGTTGKTTDVVTLRSRFPVASQDFKLGAGFRWNVVVKQ